MYGTVARMRMKPGSEAKLLELQKSFEGERIAGYKTSYVYRMNDDPSVLFLAVVFDDKASYEANAASPEQNVRYERMLALLEGPPEWHDGEIVYP